ncbi:MULTISPECIES: phage recombination protein Bet [unclassified Bradyrhizobium]|uniref:phage recombination protein Bet n=1 Tax=unclassified Bradyrhizobium TaxID=2631580 RepID=UPI001BAC83C3|nr:MULTISPECIES: phage recombination protein Bet [unclassified Bradyrhizobium]MBR1206583.1 phage recombination protein Bet [Bradyrhizobium sp. AUGA SZCCT0124]MBR1315439.1 phage recombination protein Bet [Bradyrhizobium sp. AUGA SZCCT0051]MBR1338499.1 phage recombination protein Bet [Bradyrhizobium sp. AUGA SZCCT0105]MBR1356154.1 phage recombination protein Bet [Bradyrhizobium sp. AUGA SZCCT0045]
MNAIVPRAASSLSWWDNGSSLSLVRRTYAKDCNNDEFGLFTMLCRELRLSPIRKQVYAFVFNKDNEATRQLTLVVGIDGARSIAARTGNYQPDEEPPRLEFSEEAKNPLTNPHGIVSCTVGVFHRPTPADPFRRIVGKVYWEEFAPIVTTGDPAAYEYVDTGDVWPDSGKPKMRRQLRQGAQETQRLDPKKAQWTKAGRNQIAKCAEMQALRKGWPEDLATVHEEAEVDRHASITDADYRELTPAELADQADATARLERIGGPALLATFDGAGTLVRVPHGQFYDRVDEHTRAMTPDAVARFADQNRVALQEYWAHDKNAALALKRTLEQRSQAVPA